MINSRNYLFFVTKLYSFSILEPLQSYIQNNTTGQVKWFTASAASTKSPDGEQLYSTEQVMEYNPDAVIVPGNVVPHFWPGIKVQIFHGLGEEKKGHYRVTGFFDLYCTPGKYMTEKFTKLAARHKHFIVTQTGWPKLDPLVDKVDCSNIKLEWKFDLEKPVILYAPTFSPKYSSAIDLLSEISKQRNQQWQWIVKFHNLMDPKIVKQYKALESPVFKVVETDNILPLMQMSDLLITDTSSVAYEYLLLDRPIITYKATVRKDKGINIKHPSELNSAIVSSLKNPDEFSPNRKVYLENLHPYRDGNSSKRIVEAIENVIRDNLLDGLEQKPRNWIRKRQIRKIIPS